MQYCKLNDVIKWKHFQRYWPFVWGILRSSVNSLHKGQWRRAWRFSLICTRINGWVNNREAGDLRCYRAHYDVIVMSRANMLGYEQCQAVFFSWWKKLHFLSTLYFTTWVIVKYFGTNSQYYQNRVIDRKPLKYRNIFIFWYFFFGCSYITQL